MVQKTIWKKIQEDSRKNYKINKSPIMDTAITNYELFSGKPNVPVMD